MADQVMQNDVADHRPAPARRLRAWPLAMKADAEAALFSLKCLAAGLLAYYIALRIGLNRPFWAVVTSYIIAQPLAGAVLSKAAFRLVGTVVGAAAAVVLVPMFVNEPVALSLALALWLGLCLYLSQLDRTPRGYLFVLAGYTAGIIGFPSVLAPGTIFNTAILRVQEITIGILCASLVHGAVFPRTVTKQLLLRIDMILTDARRWSEASLAGAGEASLDLERRRLAIDVFDLHQLTVHLPFDTARILPRVRTVRALQDRLSLLLPLASSCEDRLLELAKCSRGVPEPVAALVHRVRAWIASGVALPDREQTAAALIAQAGANEPPARAAVEETTDAALVWHDMLLLNLLSRLAELIAALRDAHTLSDQVRSDSIRPVSPLVVGLLAATSIRPLHFDRGLAIRSALGTVATIALGCAFWIGTAWQDGAGAVLIASIACALFSGFDNPRGAIAKMQIGSTVGLVMSIFYAYTIFPRVTDFVTLGAVLAPMLLLMGALMGKPATAAVGTGILIGFPQTVGLTATYIPNFAAALNGAIAQYIGISFAMATVGLFLTIGAQDRVARLARAGWRDVARRAGGRAPDSGRWLSRMLDRVGLMLPAMTSLAGGPGAANVDPAKPLLDALIDMRIGFVAGELDAMRRGATGEERALIAATLGGVADHFRRLRPDGYAAPDPAILAGIDRAVGVLARDATPARRREGLILLTSLRRNIFPAAPAYRAPAPGIPA